MALISPLQGKKGKITSIGYMLSLQPVAKSRHCGICLARNHLESIDSGGNVLFSDTIGVEAGEYLWYVLNSNTWANR